MDFQKSVHRIFSLINSELEKKIDGKEAILEMKEVDFQWKQMEWIGWYIEYKLRNLLTKRIGGKMGPKFGNTVFDYFNEIPWDFKAHIENSSSHPWIILNDCEAVESCIEEYGGIGYIIICGEAEFDENEDFKIWHQKLKGGKSDYVKKRIERGAPSRKRKKSFKIRDINFILIDRDILNEGISKKWIGYFQKDMRNADGSPRRSKFTLKVTKAPLTKPTNKTLLDY
ncbi:MAG: hypothetical protein GOP50_12245 [Candidatus Heimdallarchaeota archaeon]|nr:hypothetical protein [Candidatus Heimdallarchaeota archaeon]